MHLENVQNKVNKTIGFLCKLQDIFCFQITYKASSWLWRHNLWFMNTSFHQNIESIQYNAALAITGAVRGTSREKLYQELGFESLQQRRWYRKLCCLFKIINNQSPSYLFQLVPDFVQNITFWKTPFSARSGPAYQKIQKH